MPGRDRLNLRFVALVLGVIVVGCFAVWQFQGSLGNFWTHHIASVRPSSSSAAKIVSSSELVSRSSSSKQPIFWVGSRAGSELELTSSAGGPSFVRYLPAGESAGVATPSLTVAAYPMANAYKITATVATRPGSVKVKVPAGVAFYERSHPHSIYLAFAGADYQVEVFDPTPRTALHLAQSGAVKPLAKLTSTSTSSSTSAAESARAVTASSLAAIAARSGHPVYWAGTGRGTTEYRGTADGRAYVRYLPKGVNVGAARPYLTLGTYPLKHAYATTSSLSQRPNAVAVNVSKGAGVAFYLTKHPTSVYVAYPGADFQVEVFSPTPNIARQLVARGEVTTVG
jgi:hypothetical protein